MSAQLRKAERKEDRKRRYAAIKIKWKQLRTDLSASDLREALLEFCAGELKIAPIGSITELTIPQLNKILAAIDRETAQPRLPGQPSTASIELENGAVVTNLASEEQRWMIEQLFDMARWNEIAIERFLMERWKRKTPAMLTQRQARACIPTLLYLVAGTDLRRGRADNQIPVTKDQIRRHMPEIKARLARRAREAGRRLR